MSNRPAYNFAFPNWESANLVLCSYITDIGIGTIAFNEMPPRYHVFDISPMAPFIPEEYMDNFVGIIENFSEEFVCETGLREKVPEALPKLDERVYAYVKMQTDIAVSDWERQYDKSIYKELLDRLGVPEFYYKKE